MKKNYILFILHFCTICFCQQTAKVIGIKDGDTIEVLFQDKTTKVLRLTEVDCPESGQAFGKNAKQYTSSQVFGKNVTVYVTSKDRYGRAIAKVYYGKDKYLSAEIIKAGYGWWFYHYSKDKSLGELQKKAQNQKKGLWADPHAISPWDYRNSKRKPKNITK